MSDGAEEDATDIQNLIAERDELLQKLQEETEEREQISQERDELLAATTGSDNMVQLKDAFSKVGPVPKMWFQLILRKTCNTDLVAATCIHIT
jgi:light-regulated signal transduction histidine kinase (bacteriophytochrome)